MKKESELERIARICAKGGEEYYQWMAEGFFEMLRERDAEGRLKEKMGEEEYYKWSHHRYEINSDMNDLNKLLNKYLTLEQRILFAKMFFNPDDKKIYIDKEF